MKRISIYLILAFSSFTAYCQQEWVSASIENGPSPISTSLYIRTTTEFDANKCDNIVFTVRVPIAAGPNVIITESYHAPSIQHITFVIQRLNVNDGVYNYYLINGTGNVLPATGTIYDINTPYKLLELTYGGGTTNDLVQLANIENDIPGNMFLRPQFYIQTNTGDLTNYTAMFYRTGTTGVLVNNEAVTGNDFVGTSAAVLLPVKFLSFTAVKKDKNAELVWSVQNESALTDHYEVERSFNGSTFEKIGSVSAKNNGNTSNVYSSLDLNLDAMRSVGKIYYRIRQFDKDGRFAQSEIRSVNMNGKAFDVSVYPNPVVSTSKVNIDLENAGRVNIILIDAAGKEIQHAILNGIKGLNVYTLNLESVASGTYVIKVVSGSESRSIPVVKKK